MRGYTGSQEAAQRSQSGARASGMVSMVIHEGYIIVHYRLSVRCSMVGLIGSIVPRGP